MARVIFLNCKLKYEHNAEEGKEFYVYIFTQQKYKKYKKIEKKRLTVFGD